MLSILSVFKKSQYTSNLCCSCTTGRYFGNPLKMSRIRKKLHIWLMQFLVSINYNEIKIMYGKSSNFCYYVFTKKEQIRTFSTFSNGLTSISQISMMRLIPEITFSTTLVSFKFLYSSLFVHLQNLSGLYCQDFYQRDGLQIILF